MASKYQRGKMRCGVIWKSATTESRGVADGGGRLIGFRGITPLKSIQNYIDGKFVAGQREFADVNPADGSVIAQVSEADRSLVDRAGQSARKALAGEWGRAGVRERAARLRKVAEAIESRFDCFVAAEVGDTGKPISL